MQLKKSDVVQYTASNPLGVTGLVSGDIGIIEEISDQDDDYFEGIIKWQSNKVKLNSYIYPKKYLKQVNINVDPPPVRKTWYSTEGQKGLWDLVREQDEQQHIRDK